MVVMGVHIKKEALWGEQNAIVSLFLLNHEHNWNEGYVIVNQVIKGDNNNHFPEIDNLVLSSGLLT